MKRGAFVAALLIVASRARADEFAKRGRDVIALDGVAGIAWYTRALPGAGVNAETVTQAGVLGTVPFTRLGYHRFIAKGVSLGASGQLLIADRAIYYGEATVMSLAPRIGWATTMVNNTSLWLRAGASILYGTTPESAFGQVSIGGEVVVLTLLHPDFGLTFTTFIERGIAGRERYDVNNESRPVRFQTVGLSLGVVIAF